MALLGGLNLCPVKIERTEPSLESLFLEAAKA